MKNTTLQMKSAARFYVVQALFQMEAINQDLNEIKEEFENFRIGAEPVSYTHLTLPTILRV